MRRVPVEFAVAAAQSTLFRYGHRFPSVKQWVLFFFIKLTTILVDTSTGICFDQFVIAFTYPSYWYSASSAIVCTNKTVLINRTITRKDGNGTKSIRASGMDTEVGGSSLPWDDTCSASKLIHKTMPLSVEMSCVASSQVTFQVYTQNTEAEWRI